MGYTPILSISVCQKRSKVPLTNTATLAVRVNVALMYCLFTGNCGRTTVTTPGVGAAEAWSLRAQMSPLYDTTDWNHRPDALVANLHRMPAVSLERTRLLY